jgi:hypothetical protein
VAKHCCSGLCQVQLLVHPYFMVTPAVHSNTSA